MKKSIGKESVSKDIALKPKKISKQTTPATKSHTLFVEVAPERYFVLCDGRQVKNYKELADILQTINDDMFSYHVNDTKNDFANWINDVFKEEDLAKKIHAIHNRMEMSLALYKHLLDKLEKLSNKD